MSEREQSRCEPLFRAIKILSTLLEPLDERHSLPEWVEILNAVFAEIYSTEPEGFAQQIPKQHTEAILGWNAITRMIGTARIGWAEQMPATRAFRRITAIVSDVPITPESESATIDLVGWLEVALDDAPIVIVTGLNEGVVPASVTSHPFLPDRLRAALGILDNKRRLTRDRYYLKTLTAGARECYLIAGRSADNAEPRLPSRLLFDGNAEWQARIIRKFYPESTEPEAGADPSGVKQRSEAGLRIAAPEDLNLALEREITAFPVSGFRVYIECPYKFYLRYSSITPAPELLHEMDALQFGTLMHATLEWFGESGLADSTDEKINGAGLSQELDRQVRRRYGLQPHPAVLMQARAAKNRLAAFARVHTEELARGWRICASEMSFEIPIELLGKTVAIRGRIDRIDRCGELVRVMDYKTGATVQKPDSAHYDKRAEQWRDLQLPLYAWHIASCGEYGGAVPEAGYFALPKNPDQVKPLLTTWDAEMLENAYETAKGIAGKVLRPEADSFKRTEDYRACATCEYNQVCQRI